jgi:hypothetical protein
MDYQPTRLKSGSARSQQQNRTGKPIPTADAEAAVAKALARPRVELGYI